jgi:hypothetical protein
MRQLSIGEVAKRTGLRSSALRYYEQLGLLPTPATMLPSLCTAGSTATWHDSFMAQ